jgi:hypothetical protein
LLLSNKKVATMVFEGNAFYLKGLVSEKHITFVRKSWRIARMDKGHKNQIIDLEKRLVISQDGKQKCVSFDS